MRTSSDVNEIWDLSDVDNPVFAAKVPRSDPSFGTGRYRTMKISSDGRLAYVVVSDLFFESKSATVQLIDLDAHRLIDQLCALDLPKPATATWKEYSAGTPYTDPCR